MLLLKSWRLIRVPKSEWRDPTRPEDSSVTRTSYIFQKTRKATENKRKNMCAKRKTQKSLLKTVIIPNPEAKRTA